MRWSILTPDDSAHWDGQKVEFTPGVPAGGAPDPDQVEGLWRTYYGSIFNPARIKVGAMRKEMPVRFWNLLPETQDIPDLLNDAPRRVKLMVKNEPPEQDGAAAFLPEKRTIDSLRSAAAACQGCPLHGPATQTIFGEGPLDARAMFVGEQPGDQEDLAGRPFVGPAGQLLDGLLARVGIDRSQVYVTNSVKHFKFEQRGKRRIHSKPSARDVTACLPWLHAEIAAVRPRAILCLGATAAQALLGRDFRMTRDHGKLYAGTPHAPSVMAAIHPSALLRIPDPDLRRQTEAEFVEDLARFRDLLEELPATAEIARGS
jgi:DNA polymerase